MQKVQQRTRIKLTDMKLTHISSSITTHLQNLHRRQLGQTYEPHSKPHLQRSPTKETFSTFINSSLTTYPQVHNLPISKHQNPTSNHATRAARLVSPLKQIRQPSPLPCVLPPTCSTLTDSLHKRQAPPLRLGMRLGIVVVRTALS